MDSVLPKDLKSKDGNRVSANDGFESIRESLKDNPEMGAILKDVFQNDNIDEIFRKLEASEALKNTSFRYSDWNKRTAVYCLDAAGYLASEPKSVAQFLKRTLEIEDAMHTGIKSNFENSPRAQKLYNETTSVYTEMPDKPMFKEMWGDKLNVDSETQQIMALMMEKYEISHPGIDWNAPSAGNPEVRNIDVLATLAKYEQVKNTAHVTLENTNMQLDISIEESLRTPEEAILIHAKYRYDSTPLSYAIHGWDNGNIFDAYLKDPASLSYMIDKCNATRQTVIADTEAMQQHTISLPDDVRVYRGESVEGGTLGMLTDRTLVDRYGNVIKLWKKSPDPKFKSLDKYIMSIINDGTKSLDLKQKEIAYILRSQDFDNVRFTSTTLCENKAKNWSEMNQCGNNNGIPLVHEITPYGEFHGLYAENSNYISALDYSQAEITVTRGTVMVYEGATIELNADGSVARLRVKSKLVDLERLKNDINSGNTTISKVASDLHRGDDYVKDMLGKELCPKLKKLTGDIDIKHAASVLEIDASALSGIKTVEQFFDAAKPGGVLAGKSIDDLKKAFKLVEVDF